MSLFDHGLVMMDSVRTVLAAIVACRRDPNCSPAPAVRSGWCGVSTRTICLAYLEWQISEDGGSRRPVQRMEAFVQVCVNGRSCSGCVALRHNKS